MPIPSLTMSIYDAILSAALNRDILAMLEYRDLIFLSSTICPTYAFDPTPSELNGDCGPVHPLINTYENPGLTTFFLEVVLGPHLDLLSPDELKQPDDIIYPLLAARLRAKLTRAGDSGHILLLVLGPECPGEESRPGGLNKLRLRVLEVLCRML
ncbi:hypothetical protein CC85DRAFT_324696 [Cutaneotrichosporon oleaginosum]|uniref:Uncharacterized protein n=1 Tax=Cutaneotrichosporon oleaginosum TaxID=879819 RepID=A0A0J0XZ98_9TREE|nr:uncharacterized protein CC85DRAFT_324696 [Cutaneotrichosporon oleaginosum]KLT46366.1 hypothetical protein CC85DRAFT_324696 [Cutaneotrichosporon oleaginosum]TXT15264.1 hypothetical protein COLE_01457 [Cutaneotrichosporon oleaginosum]